jgi:hypothetical protein
VTAHELRLQLAALDAQDRALSAERWRLKLAIEEAEGRCAGRLARFCRAALAHDVEAMDAARAEDLAEFHRAYGHLPDDKVNAEALRLATDASAKGGA